MLLPLYTTIYPFWRKRTRKITEDRDRGLGKTTKTTEVSKSVPDIERVLKITPNLAFAGACGTNYSQFLTQRTQRRQARKGEEKGLYILSIRISITIRQLTLINLSFLLPFLLPFAFFAPLRDK